MLVFTLTDAMLFQLCDQVMPTVLKIFSVLSPADILLAAMHAYDRRGGGVETQNKGDKQGLGLSRRNKHSFAAQEILVLLAQLAHDLVIWTRNDLAQVDQRFEKYGIQRPPSAMHFKSQDESKSMQQVRLSKSHSTKIIRLPQRCRWHSQRR